MRTEMAAAEMQLLRQALDKLQSETQVLDDELARAREQAIFSEFERAELSSDLEAVTAQLQACEASKAQLESTISKVTSLHGLQEQFLYMNNDNDNNYNNLDDNVSNNNNGSDNDDNIIISNNSNKNCRQVFKPMSRYLLGMSKLSSERHFLYIEP